MDGLISTKFHNPLTMGYLTHRPNLDARLDDSLQDGCRLVLVSAPAGFGKSTLVSAWIRKQNVPFSWLSLDSSDNDPKQFLSYFVGALQKIDESFGANLINRIQTTDSSQSEAGYTDIMAYLVNEMADQPSNFMLVLDDCHVLKNPVLLHLLIFLIERQPQAMRLILITREDLPLPVSRLRVRRQMIEIRQADLQFSPTEAEDFLRVGMGISQLTNQDILALDQRTEGWIAGLQLAALSIRSDSDPSKFIQSFAGSDRYILDYLMEEVFSRQPEIIQNFLLTTSILNRFCASLCDFILEGTQDQSNGTTGHSIDMLEYLEHSNLFLIPLDHQRKWFRYHHLFADLLRHFLFQMFPDKIPALHLRASQWLESSDLIHEAVKHAFKTEDWTYAAEVVERHAWNMILHSQVGTVSEWCRTFPENIMRQRPALCILHGWALIIGFKKDDFPTANIRIEQAEAALVHIDPQADIHLVVGSYPVRLLPWVTGQLTLLRSFILMTAPRIEANPQLLVDLGQLSYQQLPPEDITGLSVSLLDICYASQARSDVKDAEEKFKNVIRVALSGGNYFGAVVAEYHRAHGMLAQGHLHEVIEFCKQKRRTYEGYFEQPIKELPAIALLDQAEGCALLELNEATEAEQLLRSGLEVGQWMPREELPGYLALARLCAAKGDLEGMEECLRRLDMRWPDIRYCTDAVRILNNLLIHADEPAARKTASLWAQTHIPEIGTGIVVPGIGPAWNDEGDYAAYIAWVQIQILLGKSTEAMSVIEPLLAVALEHQLMHRVIQLSLLQAQAFYTQGQKEHAWQPLRLALSHAESKGYLNLVNQNPVLVQLFKEALRLGIAPHYLRRILEDNGYDVERVQGQAGSTKSQSAVNMQGITDGLIEPLSNREIEVLGLMAQGLSNLEIAAKLYLSPNTLKAHTQNIFGKLDVHSRVQAVNKARNLNLI
jgi:LuxR family transcriptional regulator, maltose regulon positive regulatory protein